MFVFELYGTKNHTVDEAKDVFTLVFGQSFVPHDNSDDGEYWLHRGDNLHIKVQRNIDLGDNVPREDKHPGYPVIAYVSYPNADDATQFDLPREFLGQHGVKLLFRAKWEGRKETILFGHV